MFLAAGFILISTIFVAANGQVQYRNQMRRFEYDYIVVGAGSAGAVVASRLSEDADKSVLLLEAGGPPPDISEIPAFLGDLQGGDLDWGYYTEPQENACLGFVGKRCYWPRGKALGGTSAINGMLYVRGNKVDYDNWVRQGATGWSWNELFYYFLKSEDQRDPALAYNGFHNVGGLQTVGTNLFSTPLRDAYIDAAKEIGYNILDYNGPDQAGFSRSQSTVRDGLRCSTEKAFLQPAIARPNLDILVYAQVTKIQFDQDKRAHAVAFDHNNSSFLIRARQEIILSAGAIGSPQILMLSGIGPKNHLEELGIPVVADLPVGENLQDHVATGAFSYLLNSTVSLASDRDFTSAAYDALRSATGPLSVPAGIQNVGFVNSKYQNSSENWPDIEIVFFAGVFMPLHSFRPEFEEMMKNATAVKDLTHVLPIVLHPKSRGTIRLRSRDPYEHPIIEPCYLCEKEDLDVLVEGSKIAKRIIETPQLKQYDPKPFPAAVDGCDGSDTESDDYLRCAAKTLTYTTHHQCGTCKMGDPWDKTTVVDPELRVKGVKGLRVADASIMPSVTSGNTNAPCIMIGERAADMIRGRFWDPLQGQLQQL